MTERIRTFYTSTAKRSKLLLKMRLLNDKKKVKRNCYASTVGYENIRTLCKGFRRGQAEKRLLQFCYYSRMFKLLS